MSITRRQILAAAAGTAAVAAIPAVAIGVMEEVPDLHPIVDAWNAWIASPLTQSDWKWLEFMADLGDGEIKKILRISKIDAETLDDVLCDGPSVIF